MAFFFISLHQHASRFFVPHSFTVMNFESTVNLLSLQYNGRDSEKKRQKLYSYIHLQVKHTNTTLSNFERKKLNSFQKKLKYCGKLQSVHKPSHSRPNQSIHISFLLVAKLYTQLRKNTEWSKHASFEITSF